MFTVINVAFESTEMGCTSMHIEFLFSSSVNLCLVCLTGVSLQIQLLFLLSAMQC